MSERTHPSSPALAGITDNAAEGLATAQHSRGVTAWCLICISLVAILFALQIGRDFFIPIFAAVILALVMSPIVRWLENRHVPSPVGAAIAVGALVAVLYGCIMVFAAPITTLIDRAPQIAQQVEAKLGNLQKTIKAIEKTQESVEKVTEGDKKPEKLEVVVKQPSIFDAAAKTAPAILLQAGFTMVLLYFVLIAIGGLRATAIETRTSFAAQLKTARIYREVEQQCSGYLFTISWINAGLGAATAGVLYLFGFPDAALWGAIVAIANFIPFLGAIAVSLAITLIALVTYPSIEQALLPAAAVIVLHVTESQFVTPNILGRRLTLNPLIVFVSLGFWAWIWGTMGALMAVPLLIILKAFCDHIEGLQTLGAFIAESGAAEREEKKIEAEEAKAAAASGTDVAPSGA